jgi:hypothetical protein
MLIYKTTNFMQNWNEMDKKCCRLFWLLLYIGFDVGLNVYVEIGLGKDTNVSEMETLGVIRDFNCSLNADCCIITD